MQPVFVDAGFLIALELSDDQHHARAASHWRKLASSLPPLVTTSFVLDEVVTSFNSRGKHGKAVEIGRRLLASPSVQVMHVDEDLFRTGLGFPGDCRVSQHHPNSRLIRLITEFPAARWASAPAAAPRR